MTQLSANNLPETIQIPRYDRETITTGIVHFGVGNFHRAHQAIYVDDLLNEGVKKWGITGVSLRSPSMRNSLKPQDYLYTLAKLSEATEYRVIGAIKNILVAPENPKAVIDILAAPTTQLISSTITEKGYGLASGSVDLEHSALKTEFTSLENPMTIYGFLARGIIQRFETAAQSKLTIMCCDNISAGGELLKVGVEHLLGEHNAEAHNWSQSHVSFISSMVDRVSPSTDDALRGLVQNDTKRRDVAPVSAEPFTQWIIEDNFAGARPAFDQVGAVFVDDIEPFEKMKLGYLNCAHTIASTLGYLYGDTYVHESLERPEVLGFMRQALYENVLPNAAVPDGYDGATYIEDVIKRFQNSHLPYANLQVGTDSSQKIQQRWFPTINQALKQNADVSYFEFCLGAWVVFIQTALENDVLNDPKKAEFEKVMSDNLNENITPFLKAANSEKVKPYLKVANADQFNFYKKSSFIKAVNGYAKKIRENGIEQAVTNFAL